MTETTTSDSPAMTPATVGDVTARLVSDVARIDRELAEVDLLITQARTEAGRHDARRNAAAERMGTTGPNTDPAELAELNSQLLNLTRRAALMESQVDVLDGKRRALARHRDALAAYAEAMGAMDPAIGVEARPGAGAQVEPAPPPAASGSDAVMPAAVSRLVLGAQEDMRRDIARAMHDGPAQSLTNIILQAQIVERLVAQDPERAHGEVRQLVAMVQQTLEATKTFIFEVRPMVLDDLGLVPTLRRAARDRGKRAGVAVGFESMGVDRRLPMDLESGLFRILDEALTGYLERGAREVAIRLDWSSDGVEAVVTAGPSTTPGEGTGEAAPVGPSEPDVAPAGRDLPPALAAMMEDRRTAARNAAETARRDALMALPESIWREIRSRATSIGVIAELRVEGTELHVAADSPIED